MNNRRLFCGFLVALAVTLAMVARAEPVVLAQAPDGDSDYQGFQVRGRHLYDGAGEKVVLAGINKMVIWTDRDGIPAFPEIAKTGANVVRIVWLTEGSAEELDVAITNAIENDLIPMVDCHDSTGEWSKLQQCVDYWVRPDVLSVLKKHEPYLLVNIANEAGASELPGRIYRAGYELAIKRMRAAGIRVPLIIDADGYGQHIDALQDDGPYLIEVDPLHNLMFSIHMWWPSSVRGEGVDQLVIDEIAESVEMELPLIVGEFAARAWECKCCVPYRTIIEQCHLNEVGYLPWSWGPGNQDCGDMDMTEDGMFDTLHGWGMEVAITSTYSIQNIAVRPASVVNASVPELGFEPLDEPEGPLPDLIIDDISWTPSTVIKGDPVTFSARVTNQGDAPTPDGVIHRCLFQVNGETVAWSDDHTGAIAPGETITLTASGGPDEDAVWNDPEAGNLVAFAWVDDEGPHPYNQIRESDETNNMATVADVVRFTPPRPTPTTKPTNTPTPPPTSTPEPTAAMGPPETPSPTPGTGGSPGFDAITWVALGVVATGAFVVVLVVLIRSRAEK